MNISILAAGAGGMYCGSCMRDNALALGLRRLGHQVSLIPLYTPLRDEQTLATSNTEVFYGGVNVFLQHASKLFRHTPRMVDWVLDRPWLINTAGNFGAHTPPEKLAGFAEDIILGEDGAAAKELRRLTDFLRENVKPQVISLPNALFIGAAKVFQREVGVPVVCELTGEDVFLDAMRSDDQLRLRDAIRARAPDVTRFVATSHSYADRMADYLAVDRQMIDVVYTGLSDEYFAERNSPSRADRPLTIGYVARICPEKGTAVLVDAMKLLHAIPGMADVRLKVAGYLGPKDKKWAAALRKRADAAGLTETIEWIGEVDRDTKIELLDSIDVFTVPTVMAEPKGISIVEAMARGVPVVQPEHGSFPELIEATGGGVLVPPNDPAALAEQLAALLRDPVRRRELGERGRAAAKTTFTQDGMASDMLRVFESVTNPQLAGVAAVSV